MSTEFVDCSSFSVNYNIMGIATVSYSIIHSGSSCNSISTSISAGGQTFSGYVTNISTTMLVGTSWYETSVTLIATTN